MSFDIAQRLKCYTVYIWKDVQYKINVGRLLRIAPIVKIKRMLMRIGWIYSNVLGVVSNTSLSSTRKDSPEMPENMSSGGIPRSLSDTFSVEDNKTGE